jgi:hypothetical protein
MRTDSGPPPGLVDAGGEDTDELAVDPKTCRADAEGRPEDVGVQAARATSNAARIRDET